MTQRGKTVLAVTVATAMLAALLVPYRHGHAIAVTDKFLAHSDFGAFYCAALVRRKGGDPYLLAPLKACEIDRVYAPSGSTYADYGIDPAPLPPYDFALFIPFTFLPYRAAALLWLLLLVAATFAAADGLRRLTGFPFWAMLAMLSIGGGIECFDFGQTQPILTLALVVAALLLRSEKQRWATVATAFTLIEPHLGLAPMLALLVWSRARAAVVAAVAAAAVLSFAVGGWELQAEYVARVLPAHAFAEITIANQYSLTALLHVAGVPDALALQLGMLQYAVVVIAGVVAAGPLARRFGAPALVTFPAACAVIGGTFIHATQISAALPFALYLAAASPTATGWIWGGAALVALSWPGMESSRLVLLLDIAIVAAASILATRRKPRSTQLRVMTAMLALYFLSRAGLSRLPATTLRPPESPAAVAAAGYDRTLASTQWAIEARSPQSPDGATLPRVAVRVPTWAGLLLIFACGLAAVWGKRPEKA